MSTLFATRNSLPPATREAISGLLNQTLAELTDLQAQTRQAHWNVRGRSFYPLHKLFDELAGSLGGHLDPLAERVTALGGIARGTLRQVVAASPLPEFPTEARGELAYVTALVERFALVSTAVRQRVDEAAALGDAGSADLLTGISQDLDKALWFLEAHGQS